MSRTYKVIHLSIAFVLAVALLLLILGIQMYLEVHAIHDRMEREQLANGRREIAQAIVDVDRDIRARAERLARWDEVRQQLANPEYYVLWRDARIRADGLMTPTTDSIGLYDRNGHILAPDTGKGALPAQLPLSPPGYLARKSTSHDDLQYFFPIYADPDRRILMGYGALGFDILDELKRVRQFDFVDPDSFSLTISDHATVSMASLASQARFQSPPMRNLDRFMAAFQSALIRLTLIALFVLSLATFLIHRFMVRPLRQISNDINVMREAPGLAAEGGKSALVRIEELDNVRSSLRDYQTRVSELQLALEDSNRQLFEQAHRDALSGAFNRRAFDNDSRNLAGRSPLGRYTLLMFDCDHFKDINDQYGHAAGDAVIGALADCLQRALRAEDRLYRLGGDEFAALLQDTTREQAEDIVRRCQEQIERHDFGQYGLTMPVVLSIGVAQADPDLSFNEALRRADAAMYRAKQSSDRKVVFYAP
ncbi:MAG: diguanylate cyclase [Betaproteobacteria bacterium]|nr:diguanylate cyclase [Betaproteobacteria bacterium]